MICEVQRGEAKQRQSNAKHRYAMALRRSEASRKGMDMPRMNGEEKAKQGWEMIGNAKQRQSMAMLRDEKEWRCVERR